jgi:hypothetical protein
VDLSLQRAGQGDEVKRLGLWRSDRGRVEGAMTALGFHGSRFTLTINMVPITHILTINLINLDVAITYDLRSYDPKTMV